MKRVLLLLILYILGLLFAITFTSNANAQDSISEVKFGLLYSGWSAHHPNETGGQDGIDANAETIFKPHFRFLGGEIHPNFGASIRLNTPDDMGNRDKHIHRVYGGGVWQLKGDLLFLDLGLGLIAHSGNCSKYYGSPILLHEQIDIGIRLTECHSVSLFIDHMSNANLFDPNTGLNSVGLRLTYLF